MKVRIEVHEITCNKVTRPRKRSDELYYAYYLNLAKKGANAAQAKRNVAQKLSEIVPDVKAGRVIKPGDVQTIDIGDAKGLFFSFRAFEADNEKAYEALSKAIEHQPDYPALEWADIIPDEVYNIVNSNSPHQPSDGIGHR